MSEDIYYNEPGTQNLKGTEIGMKLNEGYSNIVRYGTIKYAIIDIINNPPKEF